MRALLSAVRRGIWIVIILLAMPAGIMAQDAVDSVQSYKFSTEELTQMLAPIALYPDALIAQILMASTYPLEVVEADRWMSQNLQLKGSDLDDALQNRNWDASLKSLCHFPDLLKSMSDKLDQTRKLGDAFLDQEEEVMTTVQELRSKARDQGHLNSSSEQKVIVEKETIRIEPANPEIVYVPVYDPAYVYGPWWYPAFPPFYWYYPPGFYGGAYIGFGPGIYFGLNAFSWVWFDWPVFRVHVDINRTRSFNHIRGSRNDYGNVWRHNPRHRRGVAYRDLQTSDRFGARNPRISSPAGTERRGYPGGRTERQAVPQTPVTRGAAPQSRQEGVTAPQVRSGSESSQRPVVRDTPFRGVGEGSFERRAGERGGVSNRSIDMRQPSGGFSGGRGGGFSEGGSRGGGRRDGSRR